MSEEEIIELNTAYAGLKDLESKANIFYKRTLACRSGEIGAHEKQRCGTYEYLSNTFGSGLVCPREYKSFATCSKEHDKEADCARQLKALLSCGTSNMPKYSAPGPKTTSCAETDNALHHCFSNRAESEDDCATEIAAAAQCEYSFACPDETDAYATCMEDGDPDACTDQRNAQVLAATKYYLNAMKQRGIAVDDWLKIVKKN
eukprot:TRINITY_DN14803_c0_g1_i1.p1 TRINITY_DN14803_c0_g1~~TRINITY_DN14803_c0_g1_i1.p1  ORF type:complete len:203 (+),score=45.05 TRINITY_DN14803_c0_g1_i1:62-670(+)